jgi:hypothetical protein
MVCVPGTGGWQCVHCGEPGEPCCELSCNRGCCVVSSVGASRRSCIDVDATCPYDGGTCGADGACSACGQLGGACCSSAGRSWCVDQNATCIDHMSCEHCGGLDEPCCYRGEQFFPVPWCDSPLRCGASSVGTCGPAS